MAHSIPAALLGGLLICSLGTVKVESSSLRLLTARAQMKADRTKTTFSIDYQASQDPQVVWFSDSPRNPYTASSTFANGKGKSTVILDATLDHLMVDIGQLHGQYFELHWNIPNTTSPVEQDLNLDQMDVQPGTDLSYTPGQNAEVTLTIPKSGTAATNNASLHHWGVWVDPITGEATGWRIPKIPFLSVETKDIGQAKQVKMTFKTKDTKVNGFFMAETEEDFAASMNNPLIEMVHDSVVFKVHENTITGPFPDDFLSVQMIDYVGRSMDTLTCIPGQTPSYLCGFMCSAFGNAVTSMRMYKVKAGSNIQTDVKPTGYGDFPYNRVNGVLFNMSDDIAGTYTCEVRMKNGVTKSQSLTVVKQQ